jgi:hypothetical protein
MMHRHHRKRRGLGSRRARALFQALERRVVLDSSYFPLSNGELTQNWENAGLISTTDNWNDVPSIEGFRGDNLTANTAVNPQTVIAGDDSGVLDVNVNQTNPNTFATGGVTEFALPSAIGATGVNTVALTGSGTADAPYIRFYVNNAGQTGPVAISYDLIDIDGSADDAIQQVALQYRIGSSGDFVDVPAGYIADASTTGIGTTNSLDVTLPSDTIGASEVQIRIITTNAAGNDEWIAVDNIRVYTTAPLGGSFAFNQSAYTVNEAAGSVTIEVLRTGVTAGAATVQFQTSAETAQSGSDFVGALGTVSFIDGQSSATFTVNLVNDSVSEPNEFFSVTLFNPSGENTLGSPATTQVTITDDDAVAAPAVFLNEISINPADADGTHEYVEIKGPAGVSLAGVYFVSIEGEGASAGLADVVVDLSPYSIGSNGLLVITGFNGHVVPSETTLVIDSRFDAVSGILENGSNSFVLLASLNAIVEGSDLDSNNDGTLDLPGSVVQVDAVGSRSAVTDQVYGAELVGSVANTTLGAMSRIPGNNSTNDASAWYAGALLDPNPLTGQDNSDFLGYNPLNVTANFPGGAVLTPGLENYATGASVPGSLYLAPVNYFVDESAGTVTVTVVRVGGTFGSLATTYATDSSGTATPGDDFTAVSDTLTFADGQFVSSFTVTINDDSAAEADETINFSLGNVAAVSNGSVLIRASDLVAPTVVLNEVLADVPSTDQPFEYVELRAAPGTLLAGLYLLVLEGDAGGTGGVGVADARFVFSGSDAVGSNGLLLITSVIDPRTPEDSQTAVLNWSQLNAGSSGFENGSITFMLVFSPTTAIAAGADLDTDNDGNLELPGDAVIIDSVGWSDGGASDIVYSPAVIIPSAGTPDAATRFPSDLTPLSQAAWYGGDLLNTAGQASQGYNPANATGNLPTEAVITPGATNFPVPSDNIQPEVLSAVFNRPTAQSITVTFSEDVGSTLSSGAFTLTNLTTAATVVVNVSTNAAGTEATLTFTGTGNSIGDSILSDGNYRLTTLASVVADPAGNFLAADQSFDFSFKNADYNGSSFVDFADLLILAQNYGATSGATFGTGDANYDGDVDFDDLLALAQRYNTGLLTEQRPAGRSRRTPFAQTVIV